MADEEKDRLVNPSGPDDPDNPPDDEETPPVNPDEDRGQEEEPEPGQGEEAARDLSDLSDEEVEQQLLESLGLGKFKSLEDLAKAYKKGEADASRIVNRLKPVAEYFGTDSEGLITSLEAQMQKVPVRDARQPGQDSGKPEGKPSVMPETIKRLEDAVERTAFDRGYDRWRARKEAKEGIEIPDHVQPELEEIVILLMRKMSPDEIKNSGTRLLDRAYRHYLREEAERKDLKDRIKSKLGAKKRQLSVTPSTRGGRTPVSETEAAAAFGFDTPP